MKNFLKLFIAFVLITATAKSQYTSSQFDVSVTATGTGIDVKFNSIPNGMQYIGATNVGITYGFVPDLANGGMVPDWQVYSDSGWHHYSYIPSLNYCEDKKSVRYVNTLRGRWFGAWISCIWTPVVGTTYSFPYNKWFFGANDIAGYLESLVQYNSPPYDGSFGCGLAADGKKKQIDICLNYYNDTQTGGMITISKQVTVSTLPYILPPCVSEGAPVTAPVVAPAIAAPTLSAPAKTTGKPPKKN